MQDVNTYIGNVIGMEGGYVNNPVDKGGETNHGITYRTARNYGYNGSMEGLTIEKAVEIYKAEYWIKPAFDKVFDIDPQLSYMMFQFGVLSGTTTSCKMLQRALNALIKSEPLIEDGNLGEITLNSFRNWLLLSHPDAKKVIRGMVMAQQSVYLMNCAKSNPNDKTFEYGWQLNRIINIGF